MTTWSPDTGFILMKQIPRAQLHVIPQRGHRVMREQAAEFDRIALSFFGAGETFNQRCAAS